MLPDRTIEWRLIGAATACFVSRNAAHVAAGCRHCEVYSHRNAVLRQPYSLLDYAVFTRRPRPSAQTTSLFTMPPNRVLRMIRRSRPKDQFSMYQISCSMRLGMLVSPR